MKVILLSAGLGSRLNKGHPKCLTLLSNGRSIMQHQIKGLLRYVEMDDIYVVVGFKKELIMEAFPELTYIYNDYFDTTNTSKSLLIGLHKVRGNSVLCINGDVVFDHRVIERIITAQHSVMAVNTASVGDEEVKYLTAKDGSIAQVSKDVKNALGESLGINKVRAENIPLLINHLENCKDSDYFEKAIETAICAGLKIYPIDVCDLLCTEVDFVEDLEKVNKQLKKTRAE